MFLQRKKKQQNSKILFLEGHPTIRRFFTFAGALLKKKPPNEKLGMRVYKRFLEKMRKIKKPAVRLVSFVADLKSGTS
jgi:hypothetical protein